MPTRKTSRILGALSVFFLAFLLLVLLAFRYGDDARWPVMLAVSAPPVVCAIPAILLLVISCVTRRRVAMGVNALSLLLAAGPLMGFHWRVSTPPVHARTVRVMTWNVDKWAWGPEAVARGVRVEHPDIVCFQEAGDYFYVRGPQGGGLMAALPDYHFVRAGEIIVGSRWPVARIGETPLPPGPRSRPALCVSVKIDGRACAVVAVHLLPSELDRHLFNSRSPVGDYSAKFAARRKSQAGALLKAMDALPGPKILCGDFNAQPPATSCRRLTHDYPDAFEAAGRGYGYTLTAARPVERIDHILTSRSVAVRDCWVPNVIASDHRAVVADITLPK